MAKLNSSPTIVIGDYAKRLSQLQDDKNLKLKSIKEIKKMLDKYYALANNIEHVFNLLLSYDPEQNSRDMIDLKVLGGDVKNTVDGMLALIDELEKQIENLQLKIDQYAAGSAAGAKAGQLNAKLKQYVKRFNKIVKSIESNFSGIDCGPYIEDDTENSMTSEAFENTERNYIDLTGDGRLTSDDVEKLKLIIRMLASGVITDEDREKIINALDTNNDGLLDALDADSLQDYINDLAEAGNQDDPVKKPTPEQEEAIDAADAASGTPVITLTPSDDTLIDIAIKIIAAVVNADPSEIRWSLSNYEDFFLTADEGATTMVDAYEWKPINENEGEVDIDFEGYSLLPTSEGSFTLSAEWTAPEDVVVPETSTKVVASIGGGRDKSIVVTRPELVSDPVEIESVEWFSDNDMMSFIIGDTLTPEIEYANELFEDVEVNLTCEVTQTNGVIAAKTVTIVMPSRPILLEKIKVENADLSKYSIKEGSSSEVHLTKLLAIYNNGDTQYVQADKVTVSVDNEDVVEIDGLTITSKDVDEDTLINVFIHVNYGEDEIQCETDYEIEPTLVILDYPKSVIELTPSEDQEIDDDVEVSAKTTDRFYDGESKITWKLTNEDDFTMEEVEDHSELNEGYTNLDSKVKVTANVTSIENLEDGDLIILGDSEFEAHDAELTLSYAWTKPEDLTEEAVDTYVTASYHNAEDVAIKVTRPELVSEEVELTKVEWSYGDVTSSDEEITVKADNQEYEETEIEVTLKAYQSNGQVLEETITLTVPAKPRPVLTVDKDEEETYTLDEENATITAEVENGDAELVNWAIDNDEDFEISDEVGASTTVTAKVTEVENDKEGTLSLVKATALDSYEGKLTVKATWEAPADVVVPAAKCTVTATYEDALEAPEVTYIREEITSPAVTADLTWKLNDIFEICTIESEENGVLEMTYANPDQDDQIVEFTVTATQSNGKELTKTIEVIIPGRHEAPYIDVIPAGDVTIDESKDFKAYVHWTAPAGLSWELSNEDDFTLTATGTVAKVAANVTEAGLPKVAGELTAKFEDGDLSYEFEASEKVVVDEATAVLTAKHKDCESVEVNITRAELEGPEVEIESVAWKSSDARYVSFDGGSQVTSDDLLEDDLAEVTPELHNNTYEDKVVTVTCELTTNAGVLTKEVEITVKGLPIEILINEEDVEEMTEPVELTTEWHGPVVEDAEYKWTHTNEAHFDLTAKGDTCTVALKKGEVYEPEYEGVKFTEVMVNGKKYEGDSITLEDAEGEISVAITTEAAEAKTWAEVKDVVKVEYADYTSEEVTIIRPELSRDEAPMNSQLWDHTKESEDMDITFMIEAEDDDIAACTLEYKNNTTKEQTIFIKLTAKNKYKVETEKTINVVIPAQKPTLEIDPSEDQTIDQDPVEMTATVAYNDGAEVEWEISNDEDFTLSAAKGLSTSVAANVTSVKITGPGEIANRQWESAKASGDAGTSAEYQDTKTNHGETINMSCEWVSPAKTVEEAKTTLTASMLDLSKSIEITRPMLKTPEAKVTQYQWVSGSNYLTFSYVGGPTTTITVVPTVKVYNSNTTDTTQNVMVEVRATCDQFAGNTANGKYFLSVGKQLTKDEAGEKLVEELAEGGEVTVNQDVHVSTGEMTITKDSDIDFNGNTFTSAGEATYGDNLVVKGANVKLKNGTVKANEGQSDAGGTILIGKNANVTLDNMTVIGGTPLHVYGDDANVTVESGDYSTNYSQVLYVEKIKDGKVTINGGVFYNDNESFGAKYLLNLKDTIIGDNDVRKFIEVTGGTFKNYNPAKSMSEPKGPVNFVADGYAVCQWTDGDDTWYMVVEEGQLPTDGLHDYTWAE